MTPKQTVFIQEYLKDFNATQAAIRAGYSKKTAYSQGQRMLKNVEIGKQINELTCELLKISKPALNYKILQSLKEIAFSTDQKTATRDRLKAMEMLSKLSGFTAEIKDESIEHSETEQIEEITQRVIRATKGLTYNEKLCHMAGLPLLNPS